MGRIAVNCLKCCVSGWVPHMKGVLHSYIGRDGCCTEFTSGRGQKIESTSVEIVGLLFMGQNIRLHER